MTDHDDAFEEQVREWLADRGRTTASDVRHAGDGIAHLPPRSLDRRRSILTAAATILVLVGVGAVLVGRVSIPGISSRPAPPDPAAFAGDPRVDACRSGMPDPGQIAQVFEMTHAEWFPLYFPSWWKGAPELEVADPALVVIGQTRPGRIAVPIASGGDGPAATPSPNFDMCIAVGPPDAAVPHQYGPTWFDRIVPVLSDADVARAAHLDPDVLADPAAWPFPERLGPCGDHPAQYVFEANPLSDFHLYFPNGPSDPGLSPDEPGIVVVLRDPLPVGEVGQRSIGPDDHDICVIYEGGPEAGSAVVLGGVDTRGFHLRIGTPSPGSSASPSEASREPDPAVTPEPAPAWAGDAALSLQCVGPPSTIGPTGPQSIDRGSTSPASAVDAYLAFVRNGALIFPSNGFLEQARAAGARLYLYEVDGRVKAVIVANAEGGREDGLWSIGSVASCDPSEFDPGTPLGTPLTIWSDASGARVPTTVILERPDCYGARTLRVAGRLFVSDPSGNAVDPEQLESTFDEDTTLPKTATEQPYGDGDRRLYLAKDGTAAYVLGRNGVQRWPHVKGDEIQRIDCN